MSDESKVQDYGRKDSPESRVQSRQSVGFVGLVGFVE